ncbi:MAG: hypothetical protein SPJ83_04325, partial [Helicobacter sp.]|uniref:putative barnase/colicin E5 family endoribonuclease n=1 Tax=Helicobacter sp. TaxID=218 RepID=UPI002A91E046
MESKAKEKDLITESNFTYTTQETKGIRDLRNDLKEALNPYLNKEIVNKEQGLSGVITTEEVKKIMSKKAIDKSVANGFSRDEHIEVAKHIERLFAESKLSRSHKDYKDNPNILQVHRFIKDININGKEANAQITLFEKIEGKNKIYTIELESLEKPTSLSTQAKSAEVAVKAQSAAATPTEAAPIAKTDTDIIPQQTINILKDMQDKDINVKLDNKELLELYEKSSREAYDFLAQKLYLDSVKQYRSDGYALFENSSLGANAKGSFEAILRKNIRQRQLENFQKPQNVKYEIQTEQGFKYYLDENNDVVINHKNELVDFKGGVVRTKPDKDGDILELNGILKLISPRNADNMFLAKRDLTNNEFYDFHANLRLANYYQNGLFISDEKLYEVFKNMPRNADKQGLDDVMGILRGLTNSKNVNMAYAQEFIDKHYGLEADYRTLARDIFKRVDKEYKKNGNPFGILFNDEKAIKDLRDMYGDEMARDFFKGKNAVDFLLYTQAGHIENAFYKEGLGGIDLVWGEVTGKGKEAKGWGLAKIIEKHLNAGDFEAFGKGEAGLINAMSEIIQDGKVITQNGVDSIILRKNGEEYRIGVSKGWDKKGENKWIITSYKNHKYKESAETSYHDTFTSKEPLENLATNIIPQTPQEIIKQAKASGKSVAETKELIQKNKELQEANAQKIQEVKEKLKQLNKESRDLAYNAPTPKYLGKGYTKTRDKKYLDYRSRFINRLKEKGIDLDYMELEKLKQDTTLKGKAKKEAMDTIYLRMYENMQQADKETDERTRAFAQKIREEELQEANEWLEKNKGASSDVDYEYKRKIAEIDKHLDFSFKHHPNDTDFIDLMNRERGKLTYAKNGDLGVVRLPEVEKFYRRGYPMDLKVLRDIQKEHNYTDKNLILNGRDFSKSFEVMRAEIEARIGIKPIKEFGTNYAEHYHSGETAIAKLINEAQAHKESGAKGEYKGQVAGAFYRKELGDIDLVWGGGGEVTDTLKRKGYGLAHILDKRKSEFIGQGLSEAEAEAKAMELINNIPNIISKGKIIRDEKGRLRIELDNQILGIKDNWHGTPTNKWIITTYEPRENVRSLYT